MSERFPAARFVADVAGGQGMLARILTKRYGCVAEVIDPRGWALRGVQSRQEDYSPDMADYYDLVVGLHPDEALRAVVDSARVRPVVVVPCCNFWTRARRLGRADLLRAIATHQEALGGAAEAVELDFSGPKNLGLILEPPVGSGRDRSR